MPNDLVDLGEFRSLAFQGRGPQGRAPDDVTLRKQCAAGGILTKADSPQLGERDVVITISTGKLDRDKDTLNPEGWDFTGYRSNPVVLWAHDYRTLPIATARKIASDAEAVHAIDHFVEREVDGGMGEVVLQMLKRKYLNAASVGFRPLKWQRNEETGGIDFMEQELLEHSIVPVPANAGSLVELRSIKGLDLAPLVKWARGFVTESRGHGTATEGDPHVDDLLDLIGLGEPRPDSFDPELMVRLAAESLLPRLPAIIDRALRKRMGRLD